MSTTEAERFLNEFCSHGLTDTPPLLCITPDYTVSHLPTVFRQIGIEMKTEKRDPNQALPDWIQKTPSYKKGLFDFDIPSQRLLMWMAYYLGETFVRSEASLRWGIGSPDYAQCNSPVIKGFSHGLEMPTIMIVENLLRDLIIKSIESNRIEEAVSYWSKMINRQPPPGN